MAIIDSLLPPLECSDEERQVIKRIVHASGDPEIARLVRFHPDAVRAAIEAIRDGMPIFADVKMVAVGIRRGIAQKFGCVIESVISHPEVVRTAREKGITRGAAAMTCLGSRLDDAVVVIGNAPTALLAVNEMIDSGTASPALVIGMPVGFVEAAESKAQLMERDVPHITIEGTRGGSAMAVAAMNALLILAEDSLLALEGEDGR